MTVSIVREPRSAVARSYDLLVIGGGIYGTALTLEAARRGLSTLLVERDDFGGATSWNSLRIVHGGLRYLQSLDLPRFSESVAERRWFLRHFPDLAEPLPCLMPLYSPPRGGPLRRPAAFRLALAANELLSRRRNEDVRPDRAIPPGRLLGAREAERLFPGVDCNGLRGGALWYDAVIPDTHRLLVEMLRWACRCGARALNYVEAADLLVEEGRAVGLRAVDRESGRPLELRAPAVVNCAGPWSRRLAGRFDRDLPELFRPVLAFNLLLDREPPSRAALAVASSAPGAQTWFLLPWKGKVLAGTRYVPVTGDGDPGSGPDERDVQGFLAELNAAWPGLRAGRDQVARILWGWLPAAAEGSDAPAARPVLHDHGAAGGPAGLISVSGVKLTTARAVVERALAKVFALRGEPLPPCGDTPRPCPDAPLPLEGFVRLAASDPEAARNHLRGIVDRQAVVHVDDLLLRRTDWGLHPDGVAAVRRCAAPFLGEDGFPEELPAARLAMGRGGR
ncbi:MAG TPA: FAD-dependent oxidoreductase [Thermoanaerobaculia bacterium]